MVNLFEHSDVFFGQFGENRDSERDRERERELRCGFFLIFFKGSVCL